MPSRQIRGKRPSRTAAKHWWWIWHINTSIIKTPPKHEYHPLGIVLHRFISTDIGWSGCSRLRKFCKQVKAKVLSNGINQIHQTLALTLADLWTWTQVLQMLIITRYPLTSAAEPLLKRTKITTVWPAAAYSSTDADGRRSGWLPYKTSTWICGISPPTVQNFEVN